MYVQNSQESLVIVYIKGIAAAAYSGTTNSSVKIPTLLHRQVIASRQQFQDNNLHLHPQNLTYSLHEAGVVTTGGLDPNPACKLHRFLSHQSANVGSSHRCRFQRCPILYLMRSLCRRLRPVSARVRSLVVKSYLGSSCCWFNTPLWPSNLSLDGRALVAASAQSAPSEVLVRFRSMPDIPTKVSLA